MSVLLVLVAHDGRTLQLDVQGQTRVEAVQQALVSATGISVSDQIIMCHGARLDPAKPLAAYKLPVADPAVAEDQPVFLYHKAFLRPGAAPPPAEPLPVLEVTVPGLPSVGLRHPLHSAHSPLIRALPDYEGQFQQQLGEARAFWEASQQRLHKCRQLMSEQEVQARAADAARANVETHYNYIAAMYSSFVDKYVSQHRHHSHLLSQFASLSAAMEAIELPQQLATQQWRVLADLQPHRGRLQEWHDSCSRSHEHFASKVAELESVFQLLRQEVERLFLQAPSVDLDALGLQLNEAEGLIDEQGSIVQVLSKDLLTVRQLVEDVVAQLGGSAGGASLAGAAVHDTCAAVDTMHDNHLHSLLPRVRVCDASVAEFLLRCGDAKSRMTKDVLQQLQGIAAQQSRIRDMKHKLAVFNEVLARQAAAFAELQTATRLPAAYRLALAECARRAAWQEMFAGQANRLAEHCGRITAKEASKRESVRRQLERYLPVDLLAKAGLLQEPPHCTVSIPPTESLLLPVTPADIARLPAIIQQASDTAAQPPAAASASESAAASSSSKLSSVLAARRRSSSDGELPPQIPSPRSTAQTSSSSRAAATVAAGSAGSVSAAGLAASTMGASALLPVGKPASVAAAGGGASGAAAFAMSGDVAGNLALENARLRAELAAVLAQQAASELGTDAGPSTSSSGSVGRSVVGASMLASTTASGASSISLAASAAVGSAQAAAAAEVASRGGRPYGHGGIAVVPVSVAAPLPSITTALQQMSQEDQQAAAAVASRQAMTLGPVQAALSAKDGLIAVLEARCTSLAAEMQGYEARISQLEDQLTTRGSSSRLQAQQQVAQRDASQQTQQDHQHQQPLRQDAASGVSGQQTAEQSMLMHSVAPAFVLDATQTGSFFGSPSIVGASAALPATAAVHWSPQVKPAAAAAAPEAGLSAAPATDTVTAAQAPVLAQPREHAQLPASAFGDSSGTIAEVPKQQTPAGSAQQQEPLQQQQVLPAAGQQPQQQQIEQQQFVAGQQGHPADNTHQQDASIDEKQQQQQQQQQQSPQGEEMLQEQRVDMQHAVQEQQQHQDQEQVVQASQGLQRSQHATLGASEEQQERKHAQQRGDADITLPQQSAEPQQLSAEPQQMLLPDLLQTQQLQAERQQADVQQQEEQQESLIEQREQETVVAAADEAVKGLQQQTSQVQQQETSDQQQEMPDQQQVAAPEQQEQQQQEMCDQQKAVPGQQQPPLQQRHQTLPQQIPVQHQGSEEEEQQQTLLPDEQRQQQDTADPQQGAEQQQQQQKSCEDVDHEEQERFDAVTQEQLSQEIDQAVPHQEGPAQQQPVPGSTAEQMQQSSVAGHAQHAHQATEQERSLQEAAAISKEDISVDLNAGTNTGFAQELPPSVVVEPAAAATAATNGPSALPTAGGSVGAGANPISVSEPDLRAVMVARPADVEADLQQDAAAAAAGMPVRSSSVGAAAAAAAVPIPRRSSRHSTDGGSAPTGSVAPAPAGAGGLTSLLSTSMHFLFHRASSSRGDSSRSENSSNSAASASPVVSPPATSPPMSPPARGSPVAAAAAAGARQLSVTAVVPSARNASSGGDGTGEGAAASDARRHQLSSVDGIFEASQTCDLAGVDSS